MICRGQHVYHYLVTIKNSPTWRLVSYVSGFLLSFMVMYVAVHGAQLKLILSHISVTSIITVKSSYSSLNEPLSLL